MVPIPTTLSLLVSIAVVIHSASSASLYKLNATEPLANAFSSTNVSASNTENVANFAANKISFANLSEPMTLVNIIRAESNVSENDGVQVNLTLELEGGDEEIVLCDVLVISNISQHAQSTIDDLMLMSYTCFPIKNVSVEVVHQETSPSVPFLTIDVNDTKINDIADFAADVIVTTINAEPAMKLAEITKAEWQSTATIINYKLTLDLRGIDRKNLLCEVTVSELTTDEAIKTRELRDYDCSLNDASSTEIEEDIPGDAVLSKWILE